MNTDYKQQLQDPRWHDIRNRVVRRDDYTCQDCLEKRKSYELNVHHSYYIPGKKLWEYPPDSLITLCEYCHNVRHTIEGKRILRPIGIRQIGVIS